MGQADWSEPSPVAELPATAAQVLATKVSPGAPLKATVNTPTGAKSIEISPSEPQAEGFAVVFDPSRVADIPVEAKPRRGSVLNFTAEKVKAIHPVTKAVVDITNEKERDKARYEVATNALVADLMGGA